MSLQPAILLLGPTGAGKTPFGDHLALKGFRGQRCLHFDFGAQLRAVAAGVSMEAGSGGFTAGERATVVEVLRTGRLLENEEFVIARKIITAFLERAGAGVRDVLIMNGLPRHVSQAAEVDRIAKIGTVIFLRCDAGTVYERIRLNTGGDRSERNDDSPEAVAARLAIFEQRTMPLLDHYRDKGVEIDEVTVAVHTTSEEMLEQLNRNG